MGVIGDVPLFGPAAVLVVLVAAGLATVVGRLLRTSAWSAFLLLASLGVIMAATMTPSIAVFVPLDRPAGGCIGGQFDLPALGRLLYPNETSLNVAMFVPLGLACGVLRTWYQVMVMSVLGAGLPFGIEVVQYAVPELGRVCSTADVAANLTGLVIGLAIGIVAIRPIGSPTSIDAAARGPR